MQLFHWNWQDACCPRHNYTKLNTDRPTNDIFVQHWFVLPCRVSSITPRCSEIFTWMFNVTFPWQLCMDYSTKTPKTCNIFDMFLFCLFLGAYAIRWVFETFDENYYITAIDICTRLFDVSLISCTSWSDKPWIINKSLHPPQQVWCDYSTMHFNYFTYGQSTCRCYWLFACALWPLLLTWFNFNPSMDK